MDRSHVRIELHGTGRAAGALGLAARRVGHHISAVFGRNPDHVAALSGLLEPCGHDPDLRILAIADDAIGDIAAALVDEPPVPTVHISGSVAVDALAPIDAPTGSFHPLQTLPAPVAGADRLPGSWIAVTADEPLASELDALAESLGCRPFRLDDAAKPIYHAAAAASANFPLAALGVAERLYSEAGVPFDAARPLVEAIVANAFELGPDAALTGPIARGDVGTVQRQLDAVIEHRPDLEPVFRSLARATAAFAGADDDMREAIG